MNTCTVMPTARPAQRWSRRQLTTFIAAGFLLNSGMAASAEGVAHDAPSDNLSFADEQSMWHEIHRNILDLKRKSLLPARPVTAAVGYIFPLQLATGLQDDETRAHVRSLR